MIMAKPAGSEIKRGFKPIKTQRAFEAVCDQVRQMVADGTLKAGDKLPAERELAVRFQISRNAVREALRSLEMSGIIRNEKGVKGGAFIQAAENEHVAQAMQDFVHLGKVSLDELTEARLSIQATVVRLACERGTDAQFDRLAAIVEQTRIETDVEARYHCAVEFYQVLAEATGNRIYALFVGALSSILQAFVAGPNYKTLQETLIDSRHRLVTALRERDCDAAVAEMTAHLDRIHQHMQENAAR